MREKKEKFYGPYILDETPEDEEDWYTKFFDDNVPRGYARVMNNEDINGNSLGKTVLFRCPCEYAEVLNLPIDEYKTNGAKWGFSKDSENKLTLNPSILNHRVTAPDGRHICCGSHFFIKNGMVEWC